MTPTVFLDRDGTMIDECGYLSRLEDVQWFPWTVDAIRALNRAGFLVVVVTNQGGIGLGLFDEAFVRAVHAHLHARLEAAGAHVDGWFFCPHHPQAVTDALRGPCDCRKPGRGMIDAACRALPIDLSRSFVVGDHPKDVALAAAVNARGVLVRTGHGDLELSRAHGAIPHAAYVAADLMEATSWILREHGHPR